MAVMEYPSKFNRSLMCFGKIMFNMQTIIFKAFLIALFVLILVDEFNI